MTTLQWNEDLDVVRSARFVAMSLRKAGFRALWVGGCVRDRLLGLEPKDIDMATDAPPQAVQRLFPENHHAVGVHFGVILVEHEGVHTEVATFRTDGAYRDARRPENVRFGTLEEDAERRDFTINALYYDPATGELIDRVGGRADLDARILRAIGDPADRFGEDALRLMRAIRFAARFDLDVEPRTLAAIQTHAALLKHISPERVREELVRTLTGPHPGRALRRMEEAGLLPHVLPEIAVMRNTPQPPAFHPEGDVLEHTICALESLPPTPTATLAIGTLLHDIGKPPTLTFADRIRFNRHQSVGAEMADAVCRRLRFSNCDRERIVALVDHHMEFMHAQDMRPARLRRMLAMDGFDEHLQLHRADCKASHGNEENVAFCEAKIRELQAQENGPKLPAPLINGKDLIAAGYKPGARMGAILEDVREAQLNGELNDLQDALNWVARRYGEDATT